jgi:hypothetical protein
MLISEALLKAVLEPPGRQKRQERNVGTAKAPRRQEGRIKKPRAFSH